MSKKQAAPTTGGDQSGAKKKREGEKLAPRIQNRRAFHDYHVLDKIECGIELVGRSRKQASTTRGGDQTGAKKKREGEKLAPRIQNRRAFHDYHVLDKIECGIELVGSEVKSIRQGKVQLGQSFAQIRNGQVTL